MSQLSKILRGDGGGALSFWCPGCKTPHLIHCGTGLGPRWAWNGNAERPSFTPSIHVKTGRAVDPAYIPGDDDPPEVCHSFVRDGHIQFLGDCTHALAGQTVDLPEWGGE